MSTWGIALYDYSPGFRNFLEKHTTERPLCVVLAALFFGQVCENVGSRLEYWIDRSSDQNGERMSVWWSFLRTAYKVEPIGLRYLRSIRLRLKFELNGFPALILGAMGVPFTRIDCPLKFLILGVMLTLAAYLRLEMRSTINLLHNIRSEHLRRIQVVE
jgi:hypothetical protein